MGKAPLDLNFKVDEEYQGEAFNPINKEYIMEGIINGYIACIMICYYKSCYKSKDLWYTFYEDFKDVTINIFNIAQQLALREL